MPKDGPAVNFMQFDDALRRRLCAIERGMGNASPITRGTINVQLLHNSLALRRAIFREPSQSSPFGSSHDEVHLR